MKMYMKGGMRNYVCLSRMKIIIICLTKVSRFIIIMPRCIQINGKQIFVSLTIEPHLKTKN